MDNYLVTYQRAKQLLKESLFMLDVVKIPVKDAFSYILAEDINSPCDLPPFKNSSRDGYAIRFHKGRRESIFRLLDLEIKAGEYKNVKLKPGEAIKVFTGSPIPDNIDAVVMKEFTEVRKNLLFVKGKIKRGEYIRFKGEEIRRGDRVLRRGTYLNPAAIGFLSSMGIKEIKVIRKPRVFIITTGDELLEPGEKPLPGKVFDANSYSLFSALKMVGVEEIRVERTGDDFNTIKRKFEEAISFGDIIIFSGGISVGDYDLVRELLERMKVRRVFYKVMQKPGKPLYFGTKGKKLVFALPGNPASVLVCFYEYVYPALRALSGFKKIFLKEEKLTLLRDIEKESDRLWFLKGKIKGDGVIPLDFQESHMLSSFVMADCLILAPRGRKLIRRGEKVKVHLI
jgi:molybdopterin molybdotransferase